MMTLNPLMVLRYANAIARGKGETLEKFIPEMDNLLQECLHPTQLDSRIIKSISNAKLKKWDLTEEMLMDIFETLRTIRTYPHVKIVIKRHYLNTDPFKKQKDDYLMKNPQFKDTFEAKYREKNDKEIAAIVANDSLRMGIQNMMSKENGLEQFVNGKLKGLIGRISQDGKLNSATLAIELAKMNVKLLVHVMETQPSRDLLTASKWTIEGFKLDLKNMATKGNNNNHNATQHSGQHSASHHQHASHTAKPPNKGKGVKMRKRKGLRWARRPGMAARSEFGTGDGMGPSSDEEELYYN